MFLNDKTILITGGTGSLGYKLVEIIRAEHKPKKIIKLTGEEEKILEKLKKKGAIQYSKIPLDVPTDISGIFYIEYSGEEELNKKLLEAIEVKN